MRGQAEVDMFREVIWHPHVFVCVCGCGQKGGKNTKVSENGRVMWIRLLLTRLSWWKSRLIYWLTFSQSVPIHCRATECLWQQQHRPVRSAAHTAADPHGIVIGCHTVFNTQWSLLQLILLLLLADRAQNYISTVWCFHLYTPIKFWTGSEDFKGNCLNQVDYIKIIFLNLNAQNGISAA